MVKALFFDAGPIISLTMSRLIWILPELKKKFGGKFYITPAVKYELVGRPLEIKRFEFEAVQVMKYLREGILEVYDKVPTVKVAELKKLSGNSFFVKGKGLDIIQEGELESVACALQEGAEGVVMDERTLRLFIENDQELTKLLGIRFKQVIVPQREQIKRFTEQLEEVKIIRSVELVAVAFELGLLKHYIPPQKDGRKIVLDSVLWATKFNGCAVTEDEIQEMEKYLLS